MSEIRCSISHSQYDFLCTDRWEGLRAQKDEAENFSEPMDPAEVIVHVRMDLWPKVSSACDEILLESVCLDTAIVMLQSPVIPHFTLRSHAAKEVTN